MGDDLTLWQFLKLQGTLYPTLHLGAYSWQFYLQMHRLQHKVCKEWHFCEKLHDPKNSDHLELADELTYFLVDKGFHHIVVVDVAALALLMIDPAELCGCEDAE